jgi:SAM-dependent methyltransferase
VSERRRFAVLPTLGVSPSTAETLTGILDRALDDAARRATAEERPVTVLDAGCGRISALRPFRGRIGRLVGVDIHAPAPGAIAHLDEFVVADLCLDGTAFEPETFDLVLSSFTLEHFGDPFAALANLARWTRPGGTLAVTTVNRRHPFVAAYLGMPAGLRARLQPMVKATAADAHPLVGACNDPRTVSRMLRDAGWSDARVVTVGHLARAWGRTWPTYAAGLIGDIATRGMPPRRSTIVAAATKPLARGPAADEDGAQVAPPADLA